MTDFDLTVFMISNDERKFDRNGWKKYYDKYGKYIVNLDVSNTVWERENIFYLQPFLNEFTAFWYLWKNPDFLKTKYISFCHYQRIPRFTEITPELLDQYDYIVEDKFATFHDVVFPFFRDSSIEQIMIEYLNDLNPDYLDIFYNVKEEMNGCGMFITTYDNFARMCEFMFGIMEKFGNWTKITNIIQYINIYIEKNRRNYYKHPWYVDYRPNCLNIYRLFAFMLEYLSALFIEIEKRLNGKLTYHVQFVHTVKEKNYIDMI